MRDELRSGILATAAALGISPVDLATAISYETAGTFDPAKRGPTTKWGQHRGLIQFGEPQAQRYGVDWSNPLGSQLGPDGAIANYLRDTGVKPGMGLLDVYSAINAGGVGRYGASDTAAGGAPGTVRDKVEQQMAGHRAKAEALLGPDYSALPDGPKGQETYQPPQPGGLLDNPSPFPQPQPFSVPTDVAQYATSGEGQSPMGKIGGLLSAIGKSIPNAPAPNLGPMPDARSYGGLLNQFLGNPTMAQMLMQKRLS